MHSLRASTDEIRTSVDLITQIAVQTRLLALNATIDAPGQATPPRVQRGGGEVKNLADEAAHSSDTIVARVDAVETAATEAISALESVTNRIREMNQMINDISAAVEGNATVGMSMGLVGLAELLRIEVSRFVHEVRGA